MKKLVLFAIVILGMNPLFAKMFNNGPIANNDFSSAVKNSEIKINFLSNDVNNSGVNIVLTYIFVNEPQHGQIVDLDDNGNLVYIPDADFVGVDKIQYYVVDALGASSELAKIEFNVVAQGSALGMMVQAGKLSKSSVSPNPVQNMSNINFESSTLGENMVHIFEITGREVKRVQLNFSSILSIHADEFNQGIYFYQLRGQDKQLLSSGRFEVLK